jgi:hypothetical protein
MNYRTALSQSLGSSGPELDWRPYRHQVIRINISFVMGILNAVISIFATAWLEWSLLLAAVGFGYLAFHIEARVRQHDARIHRCDENCR